MRSPLGMLAAELERLPASTKEQHRWLYESGRAAVEAGRIGADLARGEIDKFAVGFTLYERLQCLKKEPVDLVTLVEELLVAFSFLGRPVSGKRAKDPATLLWAKDFDGLATKHVVADRELLKIAVFNLLDNAHKYSAEGTVVQVVCYSDRSRKLTAFEVENVGLPIDRDEIIMVKQKDYRGRHARQARLERSEGTGLGLYLAWAIAEAHGGDLTIASQRRTSGDPEGYARISITLFVPEAEEKPR
ncbi:MAG: sensor histidine kinase [Phycisphaerae bacterium]|nr:sensor histidine kinase [Phycisphaerae bacterium]